MTRRCGYAFAHNDIAAAQWVSQWSLMDDVCEHVQVLVLSFFELVPATLVALRPVGVLDLQVRPRDDHRVICVAVDSRMGPDP